MLNPAKVTQAAKLFTGKSNRVKYIAMGIKGIPSKVKKSPLSKVLSLY